MAKGTFGTPRTRSDVIEIRPVTAKIRFQADGDFDLNATLNEGNEVGGVFEVEESGSLRTVERALNAADKAVVEDFLSLVIRLYSDEQGYSGVVIT